MDGLIEFTGNIAVSGITNGDIALFAVMAGFWLLWSCIGVALAVLCIVAGWIVLKKAKLPGRGILIPVYNVYLLFKLAGRPVGWTRRILFPPVLGILTIIAQFDIAKKFGKNLWRGLGLWILPFVFYPILAFSNAKYSMKVKK